MKTAPLQTNSWISTLNSEKFLPIILSALILAQGCSSESPVNSSVNDESKKPRIALIMKSLANDFFASMERGARQHQESNSIRYELICNGIKDESDLGRQVALVDEMVAAGVDAIVIAPADSKALIPAIKHAKQAGVIVVNIDNKLDQEILAKETVTVPFVGPDNRKGAAMVGNYLASKLEKGDEVAILEGKTTAFNGVQRKLGFQDAMNKAEIKVVSSQSADWETNKANTITSSILREHPNLKAVLAANDSMAIGAVAAVKALNRSKQVMVIGFDNIDAVQTLIREGKVLATADQHGEDLATFGIETALDLLAGNLITPADMQTPVDLINQSTLTD